MFQLPKNEHVTLPSVENWYTNTNILKLPPQSIQTRRRDKVGDNLQITEWIDESGDRSCEGISKFSRGVNPMVSVSYGNYNAGTSGNPISYSSKTQASLPRKVMDNGAFRAPILPPETLLPLSRLPRSKVSAQTHLSFPNNSKRSEIQTDLRAIKKEVLTTSVRPTAYMKMESLLCPTYDIENNIKKEPLLVSANSGMRTMDIVRINGQTPHKEITDIPLYAMANTSYGSDYTVKRTIDSSNFNTSKNIVDQALHANASSSYGSNYTVRGTTDSSNFDTTKQINQDALHANASVSYGSDYTVKRTIDSTNVSVEKYIHDTLSGNITTNISNPVQNVAIQQSYDKGSIKEDVLTTSYNTAIKGSNKYMFFDNDMDLERKLPVYNVSSNVSDLSRATNIQHTNSIELESKPMTSAYSNPGSSSTGIVDNISSRDAYLRPSLQKGGFNNNGFVPNGERQVSGGNMDSMRKNLKGVINNMQNARFG